MVTVNAFEQLRKAYYDYVYSNDSGLRVGDKVVIKIKFDFQCEVKHCWEAQNGVYFDRDISNWCFMGCEMRVYDDLETNFEFIKEQ